ncbi:hypothetical protein CSKR_110763 [Clonorchis sinensis]|uniref:Uncharacterized protein n=1 Tax=Clonorchis sinensis TaxID=79923 RepID=A0A3R7D3Q6_CLOSI|nr:hypothetical protein CSKR_110763 [Clonorchis sinensis]
MVRHTQHMSRPTQLLVLDTFFNGIPRCTTQNSLSNCLVTSYSSEITIVSVPLLEQAKSHNHTTKQPALCLKLVNANRALQIRALTSFVTPQSELIQLQRYVKRSKTSSVSPWIISGVFSDYMSSMTLSFMGSKCIPKDGMTLLLDGIPHRSRFTVHSRVLLRPKSLSHAKLARNSGRRFGIKPRSDWSKIRTQQPIMTQYWPNAGCQWCTQNASEFPECYCRLRYIYIYIYIYEALYKCSRLRCIFGGCFDVHASLEGSDRE